MLSHLNENVSCPQCGEEVKALNLTMHQIKRHGLDPEAYMTCSLCRQSIKQKNHRKHLKGHMKKQPTGQEMGNEKTARYRRRLCDMTPPERRRRLNALDRPDTEWSEDAMAHGRWRSGGGYGLGKSRKH